jgi:dolichol-phosphate mannosyltransferase
VINWPLGRVIMSYMASVYVRLVTRMKIMDTTAGFKCYHRKVWKQSTSTKSAQRLRISDRNEFKAWKHGFKIVEVPIIFTDRKEGTSKMSGGIFNEALWGVLKMKIRSWFTKFEQAEQ